MSRWGMEVQETEKPEEALKWVRSGEQYDLAVLDMNMPEMSGVELAEAVRGAGLAELPLVLFSSVNYNPGAGEETPFAAFLQKPLKQSLLFDTLMNIFGEAAGAKAEVAALRPGVDPEMGAKHPLRILLEIGRAHV